MDSNTKDAILEAIFSGQETLEKSLGVMPKVFKALSEDEATAIKDAFALLEKACHTFRRDAKNNGFVVHNAGTSPSKRSEWKKKSEAKKAERKAKVKAPEIVEPGDISLAEALANIEKATKAPETIQA